MANKIDLVNDRVVTEDEGRLLASSHGMMHYQCSAKTGVGVSEAFMGLARRPPPVLATATAITHNAACAPRDVAYLLPLFPAAVVARFFAAASCKLLRCALRRRRPLLTYPRARTAAIPRSKSRAVASPRRKAAASEGTALYVFLFARRGRSGDSAELPLEVLGAGGEK